MHSLSSIFHPPDRDSSTAGASAHQLDHHWSGIVLKLRGVRMLGADGHEYLAVLVERGETSESRRRRLLTKWGLSDREAEVLSWLAEGKTGVEIASLLRIKHDTVRKHTSSILEKLGVETRAAAASRAREFALSAESQQG